MSSRRSFLRKIIYVAAIGLLLIPLYLLGHPATEAAKGVQGRPGGKLAQLRKQYSLSQAQLGEVDPTSVTLKLATLGMRGVAAQILWNKAIDYKMKKDWANFGATLNQITKVQPNFLNIWVNQAWNLSYNISVEFDDYRERYRWVIKGFEFLQDGMRYNERQPKLPWELGRFTSQKIGKADEVKQYRRLLAADNDFRDTLPAELRDSCLDYRGRTDNWLLGKGWYEKAIDMPDKKGTIGQSPLMGQSGAPLCAIYYADSMEKDGTFGEQAKQAWASASRGWHDYGDKKIPCSLRQKNSDQPILIRLNDMESEEKAIEEGIAQFDKIQPGLRQKMIEGKKSLLTPAQRQALDTPPEKRTDRQRELAAQAQEATQVTNDEVARKVSDPKAKETAKRLAKEIAEREMIVAQIRSSRNVVNFEYWRQHAKTEQEPNVLDARQAVYKGDQALRDGDLRTAKIEYDKGIDLWRKVIDAHKEYIEDQTTCEDLVEMIKRYRQYLGQREQTLPEDFKLKDVLEAHKRFTGEAPSAPPVKEEVKKPAAKTEAKKSDVKDGKHKQEIKDEKKVESKKATIEIPKPKKADH
jgi:hypothetical protein